MTRITWGSPGTRTLEAGVDRGVFYPQVGAGLPWNGLVNVKEDPSDTSVPKMYVDGVPYWNNKTKESFAAVLQAYTYPEQFEEYDGTLGPAKQQRRKVFGLSYRTLIGNDISGLDHGYKIHIVYNALAMPTQMDVSSLNSDGPNATPFSWGISTKPVDIPGAKAAAHLIVDTTYANPDQVAAIEDVLYGTDGSNARLPTPQELIDLIEANSILLIVDHGDGTWTATGPDDAITMLDSTTFQIDWPSAVYLDSESYTLSSL